MVSCAQTILPLNADTSFSIPNDTYFKDTNHVFDPYVGVWIGSWNGKQLTLVIEKVEQKQITYPNGDFHYKDLLIGKYRISNLSDGAILEDNLEESTELAKIESLGRPKNNRFNFHYSDRDLCYNTGRIILKGDPMTNVLSYYYAYGDFWISQDCGYNDQANIPIPIPTISLQLYRQ